MALLYMAKGQTYGIIEALRIEALATEVNRRRQSSEAFYLVGQPFVSSAFICQAYITGPFEPSEA